MSETRRCGGIGRHAVLRGQWGKLCASSNLAIGTADILETNADA